MEIWSEHKKHKEAVKSKRANEDYKYGLTASIICLFPEVVLVFSSNKYIFFCFKFLNYSILPR